MIIADINESAGEHLALKIRKQNCNSDFYLFGQSKIEKISEAVVDLDNPFSPIDIWINCSYP